MKQQHNHRNLTDTEADGKLERLLAAYNALALRADEEPLMLTIAEVRGPLADALHIIAHLKIQLKRESRITEG